MSDLDPRWEWIELQRFGDPAPVYIKGRCNHHDTLPVRSVFDDEDGEVIAHLCLTCDAQLPAEWRR